MKPPTAIGYVSTSTATSTETKYDLCEAKAYSKMATMRFTSAQAKADYEKNFITTCMGISTTPTPTTTTTTTTANNNAPNPVTTGSSAIVEPDFTNVKVYDLDTPSGSPSGSSGSASSSEGVSEGNAENKSNTSTITNQPNYVLYGVIAISSILLYKILK